MQSISSILDKSKSTIMNFISITLVKKLASSNFTVPRESEIYHVESVRSRIFSRSMHY